MASLFKGKLITRLLGTLYCSFVAILLLVSSPVYLFRVVVIFLSKHLRPDLGDIFGGTSAVYVGDYLAETTPRSNAVLVLIFEGQLTLEEVHDLVMQNWVSPSAKLKLEKFQQYPYKWLGFTFWKNIPKAFRVQDYVHEFKGKTTDQHLDEFVETLLNKKFPREQSPWELHVIENYRGQNDKLEFHDNGQHHNSALVLKLHHCLMDGTGAFTALIEQLFQQRWVRKEATPPIILSQRETFLRKLTFPLKAFSVFSNNFSHTFVSNPFKIPDSRKRWHQVCARSGIIQNKVFKDIKNAFEVSHTSVLLSAISAAVHKTTQQKSRSVPLFTVLPAIIGTAKRKILDNHLTGTTVDLPTIHYESPIEHLKKVDQLFEESRNSVKPIAIQYCTILAGAHFSAITEFFTKNKTIPIAAQNQTDFLLAVGLTNFAASQGTIEVNKNAKWIHSRTIVGGLSGDLGINIAIFSHGLNTEILVAVESALMSREQALQFVYHIKQEVETLSALIPKSSTTIINKN